MQIKDIASKLAAIGLPLLGEAIAGPAGASALGKVATLLGLGKDATPEQIATGLGTMNGDQLVALRSLEAEEAKTQMQTAAQQVDSVNKTLQTEAMGGSFWQRNHHAYESSFVCLLVAAIYVALPMAKIPVPTVPTEVWIMLGAILGVTAWQRGQANVATARAAE